MWGIAVTRFWCILFGAALLGMGLSGAGEAGTASPEASGISIVVHSRKKNFPRLK